jgi:putative FmdB family regulatory protein
MPTYEYVCDACGHELELFQSMTEAAKRKCPDCGKLKLRRKIGTGGGILFKGSGFYLTDYRSESYRSAAKADKDGSSSKSDATTKPSDAKPSSDAKPAKKKKSSD